jgi:NitT/TauT family transport system ATP-binding protein
MEPLLSISDISFSYQDSKQKVDALSHVSIDIMPGSFTSIVGPSGCGKSTLLSIITGLLTPDSGSININSKEHPVHIGYMLQRDCLFEWRSVYKNILLGLELSKACTDEKLQKVDEMLKSYGLYDFKNAKPSELSGGMRQRVALIRTLATEPDILLLDEPFSALDYNTRLEVSDDIYNIIKEQNKTAVLVTHDISEAVSMGDTVVVMSKRPGTVKLTVPIEFAEGRKSPVAARSAREFPDYFNNIWKEIN